MSNHLKSQCLKETCMLHVWQTQHACVYIYIFIHMEMEAPCSAVTPHPQWGVAEGDWLRRKGWLTHCALTLSVGDWFRLLSSQCHFCIHSVCASQRAQTGIVQYLLLEAAQRTYRVIASQNKCQRNSLSGWCLHRPSGNRTIQVHTVCFSVVAFMGCHQWCLSHQSSWNSTTHHCSFEQLKNSSKSKVENTSTSRTRTRSFPRLEGHAGTKAQLIEPCGIPHIHSAFQRRYFFIIPRDCVLHLQVKFAVSQAEETLTSSNALETNRRQQNQ